MFGITPFRRRPMDISRRWNWDFDRVFDDMLEGFDDSRFLHHPMKVDIREDDKEYILEAELPGANKDNISIEVKNDILTLAVERKDEISEERENYIRKERRFGSFKRSFYVNDIDQKGIKAKFDNGVLKVILPKMEESSPRQNRIPIE